MAQEWEYCTAITGSSGFCVSLGYTDNVCKGCDLDNLFSLITVLFAYEAGVYWFVEFSGTLELVLFWVTVASLSSFLLFLLRIRVFGAGHPKLPHIAALVLEVLCFFCFVMLCLYGRILLTQFVQMRYGLSDIYFRKVFFSLLIFGLYFMTR